MAQATSPIILPHPAVDFSLFHLGAGSALSGFAAFEHHGSDEHGGTKEMAALPGALPWHIIRTRNILVTEILLLNVISTRR